MTNNPRFSDFQVVQALYDQTGQTISRSTVNRIRHQNRFHYLPSKRCQVLTEEQRCQRVQFSRDFLDGRLPTGELVFCDESRFCMGPDNRWVWRRRGEYPEGVFAATDKYAKISIHVWGAIGRGFKSNLIIFATNVDSDVYIQELVNSGFCEAANATYGERRWLLVQDGAPCHTSKKSWKALSELFNLFPQWPANSPDLNPIESLWGAIKRSLKWENIRTAADAVNLIRRVWADFPQGAIDALVDSFRNRVKMVSEARGRTIQPLVSAGKTQVPPGYADLYEIPLQWDGVADQQLTDAFNLLGPKWEFVAQRVPGFSAIQCKARWLVVGRRALVRFPRPA
jgi:hypothetical protein